VKPRTVAVLGGNAFVPPGGSLTMAAQFQFARAAMESLWELFEEGGEIVLGHGNGPQVGHMLARVERSLGAAYAIPLEVCVAESEGELGYVMQQTLYNTFREHGVRRPVVSVLTQVVVDPRDPAFDRPEKPIGPFYDAARAERLRAEGFPMREDSGRGYRRVVPSPEPLEIVEVDTVAALAALGVAVIAAGGGGIPVVREGDALRGIDAVVDKDLAAALLAVGLGAGRLVVVTDVPCAYTRYRSPEQAPIGRVTPEEVRRLAAEGHFAPGSMAPKMEAAARFAEHGGRAILCDARSLPEALRGEGGTIVETRRGSVGA
jgi:carbamate kinase